MRVLVFVKTLDSGTGTFALSLKKLQSKSLDITIASLEKPNYRQIDDHISFFTKKTYPSIYKYSWENIFTFYHEFLWVKNKIHKISPEVVLSIDFHCNLLTIFAVKIFFRNTRLILSTHNNIVTALKNKSTFYLLIVLRTLITLLYNMNSEHIVISKSLANSMKNDLHLKKNIKVIYYGVESCTKATNIPQKDIKNIISMGRLVEQKDFRTLIKAIAYLNNDTALLIAGDGPQMQELSSFASSIDVKRKVHFLGWKNIHDLFHKYPNSIFILSSKWEGLSYVLLEAMAHGLPVIASDCDFGPREVLTDGKYGILVEPGNVPQFVRAIKYLSNKKFYTQYSLLSLARASFFNEDKMLQEYRKLLLD